VTFYKIKKSVTLGIRLDYVFSVYLVFAIAIILQYALRCWRIATGRPFEFQSFYAVSMAAAEAEKANGARP
jgi:hypothetical protein